MLNFFKTAILPVECVPSIFLTFYYDCYFHYVVNCSLYFMLSLLRLEPTIYFNMCHYKVNKTRNEFLHSWISTLLKVLKSSFACKGSLNVTKAMPILNSQLCDDSLVVAACPAKMEQFIYRPLLYYCNIKFCGLIFHAFD